MNLLGKEGNMSNIQKLKKIIQKNFKLLLRSKSSGLIVILGPLILITLIGLAFGNAESYSLTIGTYAEEYNELTESLVESLKEEFTVDKKLSEEMCIEDVKIGEANVCIIFPKDLKVSEDTAQDIMFHIDYSDINLVYNVIESLSEKINVKSKALSEGLTSDLLTRIGKTESVVDERMPTLQNLTAKTDAIDQKTQEIQKRFEQLNLQVSTDQNSLMGVQKEIDYLRRITYTSLKDTAELLDTLNAEINSLRGNKTRVEYFLDSAEEDLLKYKNEMKNTDARLKTVVGTLQSHLSNTNEKLAEATSLKQNTNVNLDQIKGEVESSLALLTDMQVALNGIKQLSSSLEVGDAETIVSPITTQIIPVTKEQTHFNYLLPTLFVLVIMITGILLSSTLISVEKKSKSYFRNFISPTPDSIFLLGTFLTAFIVIIGQVLIFFIIAVLFFDTMVLHSLGKLAFAMVLVSSMFIMLGMLVGIFFKTEETTTLAGVTMASILLFFSNTLLPLESMPRFFQTLASLNPFVLSQELVKETFFFTLTFGNFFDRIYGLIFYIGLFFVLGILFQHWLRHKKVFLPKKTQHLWKAYKVGHRVQKYMHHTKAKGKKAYQEDQRTGVVPFIKKSFHRLKHHIHEHMGDFTQRTGPHESHGFKPRHAAQHEPDFFEGSDDIPATSMVIPATNLEKELLGEQAEPEPKKPEPASETSLSPELLMQLSQIPEPPQKTARTSSIPSPGSLPSYEKIDQEITDLKAQLQRL